MKKVFKAGIERQSRQKKPWLTLLFPAVGKQRQENLCELKASLIFKEIPRTARTVTQKKLCLEKKKTGRGGSVL